ncbi:MAG: TlpA family protein disulfide reductase [Actinobacteria bacterium]|nr:TlpA family protein disulfide reductase [Actinomycetota bacterium]
METLPADHRAPDRPARRVPPGLLAAAVLATAVVVIAVFVAIRSGSNASSSAVNGNTPFTIRGGLDKPVTDLVGQPLPDLPYTTFDEQPASLSKYRGRPLVINFWSSTCTPCITEMPDFQKVFEEVGDKVSFLGLDVQDSVESGRFLLEKTGVNYDVGSDPSGDTLVKLGGIVLPTTILVAADGTVKQLHSGQLSKEQLTEAINQYLLA